jgi:hypothetical protein
MKWGRGLVTTGGRMDTPPDGLWTAENIEVNPEGTIRSRYPFVSDIIPDMPTGEFVGPIHSFWDSATEQYNLLSIVGEKLYRFEYNSGGWVKVAETGTVSFSMSNMAAYTQYGFLIVIADGVNAMAYYDIQAKTVVRPGAQLTSNPTMSASGGAATPADYRAYYMVSYVNDFGETPGSGGGAFTTQPIVVPVALADPNQPLGKWSNTVTISLSGISTSTANNLRVRVYRVVTPDFLSPNITAYSLIKEFQTSTATTMSFTDDGSVAGRLLAPQLENSTGGLVARYVTEIDGRIWAIGVGKERQKIYYTGAAPTESQYPQFFSGEGGYFYVAYGTSYDPVTIKRGRADDGQPCNIVLCAGPNGTGRRFNIFNLSTTYGNQQIYQFYPSEQKGDEGAYSTFGVLEYMNSILYPSPGGFKSSGVRATYTNDNVTASIDLSIQETISKIPYAVFKTMYGTVYSGKAIWHSSPSDVMVFDAKNGGAWTTWTMPHRWFGTLSVGQNQAGLYVVDNGRQVLRYADETLESRQRDAIGPEYPINISSGRLTVRPDDGREWVRLLHVLFVFSEARGPINIEVRANSRRRLERYTGTVTINQDTFQNHYDEGRLLVGAEPVGFSEVDASTSNGLRGPWSKIDSWSDGPFHVDRSSSNGLVEVRVRVNKDINFLDWNITSGEGFIGMQLEEFVYEYVDIGVGLDFSSRYNEIRLRTERG